jgi:hypothetical protein
MCCSLFDYLGKTIVTIESISDDALDSFTTNGRLTGLKKIVVIQ